MASNEVKSGQNWSKSAEIYAAVVDETDLEGAAGAACTQILAIVDEALPLDKAELIVDMGCGHGPITNRLFASPKHVVQIPPSARIVAADVSHSFLDMVRDRQKQRVGDVDIWKRLEVLEWDARDLGKAVQDDSVTHLLSSYTYWAIMGEQQALAEALRVLKPGGLFVETSMGYSDWGFLPSLIQEVRPDLVPSKPGQHWASVEGATKVLSDTGFKNVRVREYDISLPLNTYDDVTTFIFEGMPGIAALAEKMSAAEVQQVKDNMVAWVKERYPSEPFRLKGIGLIGCGTK